MDELLWDSLEQFRAVTLQTGNKKDEKDVVQLTGQGVAADGMTFLQYRGDFFISVSG